MRHLTAESYIQFRKEYTYFHKTRLILAIVTDNVPKFPPLNGPSAYVGRVGSNISPRNLYPLLPTVTKYHPP